uniref:Fibrinogen C-terminal domain-containing protein n=1 Tax=Strigamia maritima TaxID=126957 RepID=T1IZ12_STRMM
MMETLLINIDARFKKMDIIDATHRFTLENMLKKMESIDNKITENSNNLASLISTIKSLDAKLKPDSKYESPHAVGSKLQSLDTKISVLSSKINQLKENILDNRLNQKNETGDLLELSSERRHIVTTPDGKMLHQTTSSKLENDLESVKGTLRGLDSKLQSQSDKMANTITNLMQTIADIREAVLDSPTDVPGINVTNSTASETGFASTSDFSTKPIKFERFGRKLRPLMHVIAKLDDIYTAIVNTRHSIDDTRQKSDQLLTRSYHTTQALTDVKYDLYYQTSKIIDNLGQVEQWLRDQTGSSSSLDPKLNSELRELLDKVDDEVTKARITQKLSEFVEKNISGDDILPFFTLPPPTKPIDEIVADSTFVTPQNSTNFLSNLAYLQTCPFQEHPGINCADLKNRGVTKSGIYYLRIKGTTYWFMKVYCEMETAGGGWTVIQRRHDYGEPHESFNRDWNEYKNGFGDLSKEFWLGNENIFMLTNQDEYTLRIDLEDFDGNKRYAEYSKFKMSSEVENYKLEIGGYDGTAGDSLNDPWYGSNLSPFSTYNRDNDRSSLNCASMLRGGWWWRSCGRGLNGLYLNDANDLAARQGIVWFRWRGWDYNLKRAQMMIRPKEYQPENEQPTTTQNSEIDTSSITTEILHNSSIEK